MTHLKYFVASNFFVTSLKDNPEQGVLYMVRGLLNVLENYAWDSQQDSKALAYCAVLAMLSAASQEVYLNHADKGG